MKLKKRLFISFLFVLIATMSLPIISNAAETRSGARVSYTYCELSQYNFIPKYPDDECFNCSNADTTIILKATNHAETRANSVIEGNSFKEAYVGIQNAEGKWKSDTRSNGNLSTVGAKVNPIGTFFKPVYALHELIYYEGEGFKMHSRAYK